MTGSTVVVCLSLCQSTSVLSMRFMFCVSSLCDATTCLSLCQSTSVLSTRFMFLFCVGSLCDATTLSTKKFCKMLWSLIVRVPMIKSRLLSSMKHSIESLNSLSLFLLHNLTSMTHFLSITTSFLPPVFNTRDCTPCIPCPLSSSHSFTL